MPQNVPSGILINGGFGSGKSHALEFLHQRALQKKFVCSRITVNKETPLHDPVKLFKAAAEAATVPGRLGNGIAEVSRTLNFGGKHYRDLREWAGSRNPPIDSRLKASLTIYESSKTDAETRDQIIRFWAGEPISSSSLQAHLRNLGLEMTRDFQALRQRDLALQRFQFISRLVLAADHPGWVIFIDEVELIGCYSRLQRAKSYAELARLAGKRPDFTCPHLVTVFAITDDFEAAVLNGKGDLTSVSALLQGPQYKNEDDLAGLAALGMRTIQKGSIQLNPPDASEIQELYDTVKATHAKAYTWSPPDVRWPEQLSSTRLRHYVKTWITEWDLRRLYPGSGLVVEQVDLKTDYSETTDESEISNGPKSTIDEILERLF